jgi:hypothetical protein
MASILLFLAEHFELVEALIEAVAAGASKDSLLKAIKQSMITASDEAMKRELGG